MGTSQMWSDAEADPLACPGAGSAERAAPPLPDGFPFGRALCPECTGFVALERGRLAPHDAYRAGDPAEDVRRAEWFNSVGWN